MEAVCRRVAIAVAILGWRCGRGWRPRTKAASSSGVVVVVAVAETPLQMLGLLVRLVWLLVA